MSELHVACKLLKQNTHTHSRPRKTLEAANVMLGDATGILIGIEQYLH